MKKLDLPKLAPWVAGGLAVLGALAVLLPDGPVRGMDLDAFGHVPVLEGGRVKPIDTVARNALLMIRGKQAARVDRDGDGKLDASIGPDEWLLDVMFRPTVADQVPIFNVNDPDVLGLMNIPQSTNHYFSFATIAPHLDEIQRQALAAERIEAQQRTRFQSAVLNLFERIYLYYRLKNTVQLDGSNGLASEISARTSATAGQRHQALSQLAYFRALIPPAGAPDDAWRNVGQTLAASVTTAQVDPSLDAWARLGVGWAGEDAALFNAAVGELHAVALEARPAAMSHSDHEWTFNHAQPFYVGMVVYVLALLTVFVSWLWKGNILRPAAFGLLVAGTLIHTAGLVSRIILQGRPPVTNLYSSAIFVGWGAVVLGVILERMYRRGFGTAVAASCGFASLIVAHHLTGSGDTMEMMRAVLDSNFWLATHVITITIGYSGTFLAGAIAIGYTLRKHLVARPDPVTTKSLSAMVYGIVCFSLFFSFLGTVLGGIWADQSWGRFWGWDPKENGALLIVLWNAIILHARWGGYARERGIMTMAIFGNVITSLSWFGVNMLGVGLHSYGFMDSAFFALSGFIASQLVLMALCLAPPRFWAARTTEPGAAA